MAKRKKLIPDYGTTVIKGVEYYRTRIEDADGKRVALYALTPEELYEKVEEACKALFRPEVDFVGTNPDYRCPTAFGFVPDCGGICEMLKVTTDRTPYYAGKPNAQIVKMCMEQVGAKPEEVLVVGDRLYTDIACGINAGVETALVYTGEAKPEDLVATEFMPDYAFENIRKLYEAFRKSREAVTEGKNPDIQMYSKQI